MSKKSTPTAFVYDKEMFKRSVLYNVKTLYRKTLEEASQQQIFQAVAYAVKDTVVDNWLASRRSSTSRTPRWYIIFPWNF